MILDPKRLLSHDIHSDRLGIEFCVKKVNVTFHLDNLFETKRTTALQSLSFMHSSDVNEQVRFGIGGVVAEITFNIPFLVGMEDFFVANQSCFL